MTWPNAVLGGVILVALHGLDSQTIWVNPRRVVSVRAPREVGQANLHPGVACMVEMSDGKFVAVVDGCGKVLEMLLPDRPPVT